MSSTDYIPGIGRVIIRNTTPYARVHNEGASIGVTTRMKGFFWARHYESKGGKEKLHPFSPAFLNIQEGS